MKKRKLHHYLTILRKVNYWYLVAACLLTGLVSAMALRHNNLTVLNMRQEVLRVDKENGNTELALRKLRQYVYGHMNTQLSSETNVYPPIQLKYRYQRLLDAQKAATVDTNTKIYNDAQKYCERLLPTGVSLDRVPCIQQYLDTHPAQAIQPIPDSLYKFDFASPAWTPDLAGLSLVLFFFLLMLLAVALILKLWLRRQLKQHL